MHIIDVSLFVIVVINVYNGKEPWGPASAVPEHSLVSSSTAFEEGASTSTSPPERVPDSSPSLGGSGEGVGTSAG